MKKRPILASVIIIIIILIGYINITEPFSVIRENVKAVENCVGILLQYVKYEYLPSDTNIHPIEEVRPFTFLVIAPFLWDSAYAFEPGTTKSEIESIIGFKDRHIPKVVEQGKAQLLFIFKDRVTLKDEVVCNIYGDTRYVFYLGEFKDKYIKLESSKIPVLRQKVVDGVLVFVLVDYDDIPIYSPWFGKDSE